MFYVLDGLLLLDTTAANEEHFVRSALAVVDRTERSLAGSLPSHVPQDAEYVLRLANFSADLLACIQLWQWEQSGELPYLSESLPTFANAILDLKARIVAEPRQFLRAGPSASELFELVAGVRSRDFRFCSELGGVFLVAEIDEDPLVEALAQLVVQLSKQSNGVPHETKPSSSAVRPDVSIMAELASIPGVTVAAVIGSMNYDVQLA
jgi:hypothetical protein